MKLTASQQRRIDVMTVGEMPRSKMQKITIAFDIDGTLIGEEFANPRVLELFKILGSFKNVRLIIWSGGGYDYALDWARRLGLENMAWKIASKIEYKELDVDIAIDDIQECNLAKLNLIVREK